MYLLVYNLYKVIVINIIMIYLIITTCINNKYGVSNYELRKEEYLTNIKHTLSILPPSIKPIIVENNGQRETYLDELKIDVIYTENNKIRVPHKGIIELQDIQFVARKYDMKDDDIIIKLTGRYKLIDDSFFQTILNNQHKHAFVKFFNVCQLKYMQYDCVLGLYAIKCWHIKNMVHINLKNSSEIEFALYVRNTVFPEKLFEIKNLGLRCCFADDLRTIDV